MAFITAPNDPLTTPVAVTFMVGAISAGVLIGSPPQPSAGRPITPASNPTDKNDNRLMIAPPPCARPYCGLGEEVVGELRFCASPSRFRAQGPRVEPSFCAI